MGYARNEVLEKYFAEHPYIEDDWETLARYFEYVAKETGFTISNVNAKYFRIKRRGKKKKVKKYNVTEELQTRRLHAAIKELKTEKEALIKRLEDSEAQYDALSNIKQHTELKEIRIIEQTSTHEVVPVISISDIHAEETVESEVVNNLNAYNLDIAAKRVTQVFSNSLKLVRMFQNKDKINTVVISLLGDNITGYIHEELMESNSLSPTEATRFIKGHLISGIKLFADLGYQIKIPCARGNHGRTTIRKRFSTGYKNSYEFGMYLDMADFFVHAGYTNVEFIISKSEYTYLQIFDKMNRFCHGDHFGYSGGVGGIFPSMLKFLYRMNETMNADCTFLGHWHKYTPLAKEYKVVVNGSVIGVAPYGLNFGASQPIQNIQLIDSKYGYTGNFPVICE